MSDYNQHWTRDPPVEEGWYWWRMAGYAPVVLQVIRRDDWVEGMFVFNMVTPDYQGDRRVEDMEGEWYRPLKVPE